MSDPSMSSLNALTPEKWKRPEDVMKLHRLRLKKKALQARMNRSEAPSATSATLSLEPAFTKRKNPFR